MLAEHSDEVLDAVLYLILRPGDGKVSELAVARRLMAAALNRHGLVVASETTLATGTAERDAGRAMMAPLARPGRTTLGADKNYDTRAFVAEMRRLIELDAAATSRWRSMAGRTSLAIELVGNFMSLARDGRVRILAVTARSGCPACPMCRPWRRPCPASRRWAGPGC